MTTTASKVALVAIDGPVGVGKSTVARRVAERLRFRHLDTGAMYRSVAWKVLQLPESDRTPDRVAHIAATLAIDIREDGSIWVEGQDVSLAIREEEVGRNVHLAADNPRVREALVAQQQRIGRQCPSVLEGRDITTVVFPDAQWKFYLDASPEIRVQRRAQQLKQMGKSVTHAEIYRNLSERDTRDRAREWGALRIASDATVVDTTDLSEDGVVTLICALVLENPAT